MWTSSESALVHASGASRSDLRRANYVFDEVHEKEDESPCECDRRKRPERRFDSPDTREDARGQRHADWNDDAHQNLA